MYIFLIPIVLGELEGDNENIDEENATKEEEREREIGEY